MPILNKLKEKFGTFMDTAAQKLAYSTEDIEARKQKAGIKYVFDGGNGTLLEAYEDRVILYHNKSLFGKYAAFFENNVGEKTLYYMDISSVEFKEAQTYCIGYIRFSILSGGEIRKSVGGAADDLNAVAIAGVKKNEEAAKISRFLSQHISDSRKKSNSNILMQTSNADELKKFKELLVSGVISQEEFDAKKKQLLGL